MYSTLEEKESQMQMIMRKREGDYLRRAEQL